MLVVNQVCLDVDSPSLALLHLMSESPESSAKVYGSIPSHYVTPSGILFLADPRRTDPWRDIIPENFARLTE